MSDRASASIPPEPLKTLWLRDLISSHYRDALSTLPASHLRLLGDGIKKARIRTFGWDSTCAAGGERLLGRDCIRPTALELLRRIHEGDRGLKAAEEEAKVPLVFVAMDIGGTIVKQVRTKPWTALSVEFS